MLAGDEEDEEGQGFKMYLWPVNKISDIVFYPFLKKVFTNLGILCDVTKGGFNQ